MDKQKAKELLSQLQRLKVVSKDGELGGVLYDISTKLALAKGERGDTPQKGVDYFTDKEVNQIIREITNSIRIPDDGKTPTKKELVELIKPLIPKPIKGDKGDTVTNQIIETIIEKTPIVKEVAVADAPEVIVSKLESLEDEDRLKISAIDKLQEKLDELKKQIDKKVIIYGGGGSGGGKTVKAHDLSTSLNGVLKTFGLPAFWRVISVVSSSFPTAFRPTVDYVTDAGASTITFTSEIDAATTLASGQTIIITYAEN